MARKKNRASHIRRTHRSLGASAAIFIIFMVLTGIIINHSHSLGLDRRHLSQSFMLEWYGLAKPDKVVSYSIGEDWLSFAGSQIYLDDLPVSDISDVVGVVLFNGIFIIAGKEELLLLDRTGQLIERQPWQGNETSAIESIGLLSDGSVVLKSGHQIWQADSDLISWKPAGNPPAEPGWSTPADTPGPLLQTITRQYRGEGPSLERLLLDLHSGRFFGPAGVLVYDLLALTLGFLAISGLILWFRGKRNGKPKTKGSKRQ